MVTCTRLQQLNDEFKSTERFVEGSVLASHLFPVFRIDSFPSVIAVYLVCLKVYVLKRPHVDEFLQKMGELFECVLFTASLAKVRVSRVSSHCA